MAESAQQDIDEEREVTPYTIAEAYARGELTRDQVVAQLIAYDYLPQDDVPDDMSVEIGLHIDGSWDDVEQAHHDRLIDDEIYRTVMEATHPPAPVSRGLK